MDAVGAALPGKAAADGTPASQGKRVAEKNGAALSEAKRPKPEAEGTGEAAAKSAPLPQPPSALPSAPPRPRPPPPNTITVKSVVAFLRRQNANVAIEQPTEVACMSRMADLTWKYGDKSKYGHFRLTPDMLPADLNKGFEDFDRTYETPTPDSLEHVLAALKACGGSGMPRRPKVVAWRGILTKLMSTPFLARDEYQVAIWKHRGVLYLSNRETEEKVEADKAITSKLKRFMYFGYKFEEVCTRPSGAASEERRVDPRECYCRVFKTKIGATTVVAAAEMDCFDPERKADVELKVSRVIENAKQTRTFERYKLLKFYCQSFLAGVPLIVVGFRDDAGVVRTTKTIETLKIPRGLRGREAELWDARVCLQFLDYALLWLDALVPDCEGEDVNASQVYLLRSDGSGTLTVRPASRTDAERIEQSLYI